MEEAVAEDLRERVRALDAPAKLAVEPIGPRALSANEEDKGSQPSMWRSLLQLRVLLPYLSRLVPLLDGTAAQSHAQTQEIQHGLAEVQTGHRELRGYFQDQTLQLRRVEEQLERVREATERNTLEQQELIEDLKSAAGTVRFLAILVILLLLSVSGMLVWLLFHLRH